MVHRYYGRHDEKTGFAGMLSSSSVLFLLLQLAVIVPNSYASISEITTTNNRRILKSRHENDSDVPLLVSTATTTTGGTLTSEEIDEEDEDIQREINGKESNDEWWRDPWALFEEETNIPSNNSDNDNNNDNSEMSSSYELLMSQDKEGNNDSMTEKATEADACLKKETNKNQNHNSIIKKSKLSAPALPALFILSKLRSMFPMIAVPSNIVPLFITLAGAQYVLNHVVIKKKEQDSIAKNEEDEDYQYQQQKQQQQEDQIENKKIPMMTTNAKETAPSSFMSTLLKQIKQKNPLVSFSNNAGKRKHSLKNNEENIPLEDLLSSTATSTTTKNNQNNEKMNQSSNPRNKSKKEMMKQIQRWRDSAMKAEQDNEQLIVESDRLNGEMATMQAESSNLQSSMRYLKSQLRDNRQEAENAILHERQKSEREMAKVRDALIKVLRHERNLMRKQVQKTSAQVRALLEEDVDDVENENNTHHQGISSSDIRSS